MFKLLPSQISLGTVIAHEEKDAIEAEVRQLSGADPGTRDYLCHYRQGLKTIKEGLSSAKLQEYQGATTNWVEEGYPLEVQRRSVRVWRAKTFSKLASLQGMLTKRASCLPSPSQRFNLEILSSKPYVWPSIRTLKES